MNTAIQNLNEIFNTHNCIPDDVYKRKFKFNRFFVPRILYTSRLSEVYSALFRLDGASEIAFQNLTSITGNDKKPIVIARSDEYSNISELIDTSIIPIEFESIGFVSSTAKWAIWARLPEDIGILSTNNLDIIHDVDLMGLLQFDTLDNLSRPHDSGGSGYYPEIPEAIKNRLNDIYAVGNL